MSATLDGVETRYARIVQRLRMSQEPDCVKSHGVSGVSHRLRLDVLLDRDIKLCSFDPKLRYLVHLNGKGGN